MELLEFKNKILNLCNVSEVKNIGEALMKVVLNNETYFFDELAKTGLKLSDVGKILGNYMYRHYFCKSGQFTIPTEENYKKLQSTGFFQRPFDEIVSEYKAEQRKYKAEYTYNPQGVKSCLPTLHREIKKSNIYNKQKTHDWIQTVTNYPNNLLEIKNVNVSAKRLHPTQKPVELLEYLIKTYSNKGETVLDNCMGSGSTGVACINTGHNFIGIELDENFYKIAESRIIEKGGEKH